MDVVPKNGTDRSSSTQMTQMDAVVEGKLVLPPDTSARRVTKKQYPPPPPGKKIIFRWSRVDPRTGQVVYAHNRPFPIEVDDDGSV